MKSWKACLLLLSLGAFAQMPSIQSLCLKDGWDILVDYVDSANSAASLRDTLNARFDTVYVQGSCDSITIFGKTNPPIVLTFQLGNLKRTDSCTLTLDVYQPFDALLHDTTINVCALVGVEMAAGKAVGPALHASPSPAAPATTLSYALPRAAEVHLAVYDLQGRRLNTLATGVQAAGLHTARWNGARLSPGVYVVRLSVEGRESSLRLLLAR